MNKDLMHLLHFIALLERTKRALDFVFVCIAIKAKVGQHKLDHNHVFYNTAAALNGRDLDHDFKMGMWFTWIGNFNAPVVSLPIFYYICM